MHSDVQASGFFLCSTYFFPSHTTVLFTFLDGAPRPLLLVLLLSRRSVLHTRVALIHLYAPTCDCFCLLSLVKSGQLVLHLRGKRVCMYARRVTMFRIFLAFKRFGESVHGKEGRDGGMTRLLMHGSQCVRFEWGLWGSIGACNGRLG